jgi:hypothetical protein
MRINYVMVERTGQLDSVDGDGESVATSIAVGLGSSVDITLLVALISM